MLFKRVMLVRGKGCLGIGKHLVESTGTRSPSGVVHKCAPAHLTLIHNEKTELLM